MVGRSFKTKVTIPKGRNGRPLKGLKRTQKRVSQRLRDTSPLSKSSGSVGDELAKLSGLPASQRRNRPKNDPFNQIGL